MGSDQESKPLLLKGSGKGNQLLQVKVTNAPSIGTRSGNSATEAAPNRPLSEVVPKWFAVCRRWFQSEERWKARGYAAGTIVTALMTTGLMVRISYAQRNFQTALSEKDQPGFHAALWQFVGIIVLATPSFALADWLELCGMLTPWAICAFGAAVRSPGLKAACQPEANDSGSDMEQARLKLEWRRYLTHQLLGAYFADRAFFNLKLKSSGIDNPDQRICDDIPSFTDTSVFLVLGMTRKFFNCVAFAGVLWSIAPSLVFFLLAYAIIGTWLTTSVFGRRLMRLHYSILRREGDLRFDLVRVRENAESIAFYKGEHREAAIAGGRLESLVHTSRLKLAWEAALSFWTNGYTYATILIPSLLTAPRYFAGQIEFGVISQVGFAFHRIETALTMLVQNLSELSGLAAKTERINTLFTVLLESPVSSSRSRIAQMQSAAAGVLIEGLTLAPPGGGRPLTSALNLSVEPGQSLLIVGPSGCGKSSLLRAIAGLWNEGEGIIHTPMSGGVFFLPQQPFMPLGNLRQQLLFPAGDEESVVDGAGSLGPVSDKTLLGLLDDVRLSGLVERTGGLDAEADWAHMLSQGEQQRVAWLRLLLHSPGLAFLDEATGALDAETEAALYRRLQQGAQSSAIVSVGEMAFDFLGGHRMQLLQFHTHVLANEGGTNWRHYRAEEYKRLLQARGVPFV